jgi:hypothetical protein
MVLLSIFLNSARASLPSNQTKLVKCECDRSTSSVAKTFVVVVTLTLALSGCSQPWNPDTDPHIVACRDYGFSPETPQFDQCMQKFKDIESQRANRSRL